MSELQAALLAIGFGVIIAVYVFGWWQQRRYRSKFGTAFMASHADALYRSNDDIPAERVQHSPLAELAEGSIDAVSDIDGGSGEILMPTERLKLRRSPLSLACMKASISG